MLYVVSTPIGNIQDITLRGVEVLRSADVIAAEDTRRTGQLLKKLGIKPKKLATYNEHREYSRIKGLTRVMQGGGSVALVSDNGTPCLSDPGFKLVRECISNGIDVVPIPGPSAALACLVASGLPTDSFFFYGFVPKKQGKRNELFKNIRGMSETVILYESPHRIAKTLGFIEKIMPEKNICIGRELTKKFEEFIRGTPGEVIEKVGNRQLKGEIVIIIGKKSL